MKARRIFIAVSVLIIGARVLFMAAGGVVFMAERIKRDAPPQIHTESDPICHHFPELPEATEIQWCSQTSDGMGLTTIKLYFFAFYDYDVSTELQDMGMEGEGEHIELYFVPDGINADEKWRLVENAGLVFQTGIKDTRKLYANAYINETGTILYVEAIGGG